MSGRATPKQLAALIAERIDLDALADKLADRLEADEDLTPSQCARLYGRTASWWRKHADELGGVREGNGPKPRITFSRRKLERIRQTRRAA